MTPSELKKMCREWDWSKEGFRRIVAEAIKIWDTYFLVEKLGVPPGTITRWAAGKNYPVPLLREAMVNAIDHLAALPALERVAGEDLLV